MLTSLLLTFLGLAALIVVAGTFLSNYADVLAERTGVGRTMGGLLLLASATSLPELAVDCKAALIGKPDIAVGAVLGSSIFNLLILGTLDLLFSRRDPIISSLSSRHSLSAVTTMLLSAIVVGFLVLKELPVEFAFGDYVSFGYGTLLAFLFYLYCLRVIYLDQLRANAEQAAEEPAELPADAMSMKHALVGYLIATIVILVTASLMAPTADRLAEITNLGGTFIGSTLIALTTSLPELVTTLAAIRMGAFDMAVGNILGSNAFNMAILFPVDLFYRHGSGSLLKDAELSNAMTGSSVLVVTGVVVLSFLNRPRRRNAFLDPGAGLVVVLASVSFVALYYLTPAAQ